MKRIVWFAAAVIAIGCFSIVLDAQTFKVQKFSIGGEGGAVRLRFVWVH